MARCDYCKSFMLWSGVEKSGRKFCNEECLQSGRLMAAAEGLPQHVVDREVAITRRNSCPECNGPGPSDVHTSHTVMSILIMTSWRSTPHVCCRSCGLKKQLTGIVSSGLLGWWGFPWGMIMTPIQICRNIGGILAAPAPDVPSEQYELLIRLDLAGRVAAGEPLPGGRKRPEVTSRTEPADDRIPVECNACGKSFKAKAAMAGKSGKCPGCGASITVPDEEVWLDDEDADDEWGGGSYDGYSNEDSYDDGNPYADDWGQSGSTRHSAGTSRSKPKKKTWTPLKVGLALGLGAGALSILGVLVGIVMATFDDDPEPQFGQNDPIVVPQFNRPVNEPDALRNRPEFRLPDHLPLQPNDTPPPRAPNLSLDNAQVRNAIASATPDLSDTPQQDTVQQPVQTTLPASSPKSIAATPPVKPLDNVDQAADVWVVLSNLRPAPNGGPFNKPFQVDYQLASGSPAAAGKYVLHLSKQLGGGTFFHTADVSIELKASGSVDFNIPPQFGPGTDFVATIALPAGPRKWKHVSGELTPGGSATVAERPPTIREQAGASAQGKVVAIANPVFDSGSGPFAALTVDFDLQQQIELARYYMLVAETSNGKRFEFDVKFTLQRAKVGDEGKFSARLSGPVGELKPPFTLHVEKRTSRFPIPSRTETPEIVSNKVNVAS
jgi:hypothetical protein